MDDQDKKAFTDEAMQLGETIGYLSRYKQELLKLASAAGVKDFTWRGKTYCISFRNERLVVDVFAPAPKAEDILASCNRLSDLLTNPNGFPSWALARDQAAQDLFELLKVKLKKG